MARILVVDDLPENVRLLEAMLTPRGYEVAGAPDGETALGLVEREAPDLVLLDVQRLYAEVEEHVDAEYTLKGFSRPVAAFNVLALR